LLALVVMWIGLLVLAAWSALNTRQNMINEREAGLKRVVETAEGILKSYAAEVAAGKTSLADAQKQALERIAAMRYDNDNYIFVFDSKPVVLMHPTNKSVVGKNVRLISSLRLRKCSGNKRTAALKTNPRENQTFCHHQPLRQNKAMIGDNTKSEARPKLGLIEARKIAVKASAIAYATVAVRRCCRKKQARNWISR